MDHLTLCLARAGTALHLRFAGGHRYLPLAAPELRWVTFYSVPTDKGHGVRLAYNERAAVARLLVPALLGDYPSRPPRADDLPETVSLGEVQERFPDVYRDCLELFPELVAVRGDAPIPVRTRVAHHLAEVARVAEAVAILERGGPAAVAALGPVLDRCHASLRDLYGVSTPAVEALRDTVRRHGAVLGARLMGGGFGGNVLALVVAADITSVLDHVQASYYAPRGRAAVAEGAVMVATPGAGLGALTLDA